MAKVFRLHWLYYAAAVAALAFGTMSVTTSAPKPERREPQGAVNAPGYAAFIAATGVVEPASQVVSVTPDVDGVVRSVFVKAGDRVLAGDPLFALDDGEAIARIRRAEARLARARAEVLLRQAEARAAHARAEAERLDAARLRSSVERFRPLRQEAISEEQFDQMAADAEAAAFGWRSAREAARAGDATAEAAAQEAGVAEAELAEARAAHQRTIMRAPVAGSVLRVDARAGEASRAGGARQPTVSVGDIDTLHLRVEIDEANAPDYAPEAAAEAALRGAAGERIALKLISADRMLKSRSGFRDASIEPVDSRVLEVRYAIVSSPTRLYAGQLLDVYIARGGAEAAAAKPATIAAATDQSLRP